MQRKESNLKFGMVERHEYFRPETYDENDPDQDLRDPLDNYNRNRFGDDDDDDDDDEEEAEDPYKVDPFSEEYHVDKNFHDDIDFDDEDSDDALPPPIRTNNNTSFREAQSPRNTNAAAGKVPTRQGSITQASSPRSLLSRQSSMQSGFSEYTTVTSSAAASPRAATAVGSDGEGGGGEGGLEKKQSFFRTPSMHVKSMDTIADGEDPNSILNRGSSFLGSPTNDPHHPNFLDAVNAGAADGRGGRPAVQKQSSIQVAMALLGLENPDGTAAGGNGAALTAAGGGKGGKKSATGAANANNNAGNEALTAEERSRAKLIFQHVSSDEEKLRINFQEYQQALILLGIHEKFDKINAFFVAEHSASIEFSVFLRIIIKLIQDKDSSLHIENIQSLIEKNFHELYEGINADGADNCRDERGERYLVVRDLRNFLVTRGNGLTEEEVSELIRETKPITIKLKNGTQTQRIYLEQYRNMLISNNS